MSPCQTYNLTGSNAGLPPAIPLRPQRTGFRRASEATLEAHGRSGCLWQHCSPVHVWLAAVLGFGGSCTVARAEMKRGGGAQSLDGAASVPHYMAYSFAIFGILEFLEVFWLTAGMLRGG